jgi:hypothetical protein
MRISRIRGSS